MLAHPWLFVNTGDGPALRGRAIQSGWRRSSLYWLVPFFAALDDDSGLLDRRHVRITFGGRLALFFNDLRVRTIT